MAIYCISDLHGQFTLFKKMLDKINFSSEDTLYVLGDVVDRGKDGIECLQYILNHPQMQMILGNHEKMMIDVLYSKTNLPRSIRSWNRNGNGPTIDGLIQLSDEEQLDLLTKVSKLPLYKELSVQGKSYYLVHGSPYSVKEEDFVQVDRRDYRDYFVWERFNKDQQFFPDKIVIAGHTPTSYLQDITPLTIWHGNNIIDIDCGCAMLGDGGRCGCLCLDTLEEFYVDE